MGRNITIAKMQADTGHVQADILLHCQYDNDKLFCPSDKYIGIVNVLALPLEITCKR